MSVITSNYKRNKTRNPEDPEASPQNLRVFGSSHLKIVRGWPPSRRAAQAARIRRQKPWLRSTGPRTAAGKAATRHNALKHGHRSMALRRLKTLLRQQRAFMRLLLPSLQIPVIPQRSEGILFYGSVQDPSAPLRDDKQKDGKRNIMSYPSDPASNIR